MRAIMDGDGLLRVVHPMVDEFGDAYNGAALMPGGLQVMFSNGDGWDHVSVSRRDRCPTWEEMCRVKARFFEPGECVVQYHPPTSTYVNVHPFCLHLWRWQGGTFPAPPTWMIG